MPTPLEKEREKMMNHEADDFPVLLHRPSGRNWGIWLVALLVGLAFPLVYAIMSLLSAIIQ